MSELHKFLFEGLPVRGMLVRLGSSWREVLERRQGEAAYPAPVRALLGQMCAAGVLMQANIKFNGALVLQVFGDGPVKLAVAEVQSTLGFRATAKVVGPVPDDAQLRTMLNVHGKGRCAITLDPQDKLPGQQPYQGIVPLNGDHGEALQELSQVLEHYMLQSEQLDTRLVLASDDRVAAGLLIQRLPIEGLGNLAARSDGDDIADADHFNRIAHLTATLTRDELLGLDAETLLRRLYWDERLMRLDTGPRAPHFRCSCSRERVAQMLRGLGRTECEDIVQEQGRVEIGCDFCGAQYSFDVVDVGELFTPERDHPPGSTALN